MSVRPSGPAPVRFHLEEKARAARVEALRGRSERCELCPRRCGAQRLSGERGRCGAAALPPVGWWGPHCGEEPPVSGSAGAGNVFFAGCSVGCVFCQNHQISRPEAARLRTEMTVAGLADAYLELQGRGCHNICWVTPTHVLPWAVEALFKADLKGLNLPLVYNSSGYDPADTLELLDGIVDVYLPDFKYGRHAPLNLLCAVDDYWEVATEALCEMWRQVGGLEVDGSGLARKGLVVRHLVLPGDLADTGSVLSFLAGRMAGRTAGRTGDRMLGNVTVSLMAQYTPTGNGLVPPLDRPLDETEYLRAVDLLSKLGIEEGWVQDLDAGKCLTPDFDRVNPF